MKPPGAKHIICIDVTNRCDVLRCSNCTRGLLYQPERVDMTPENFRRACESLVGYAEIPGNIIAVIGGNPCVSPLFEEYCRIFAEVIPQKEARGLWTNNLAGHGTLARATFGRFNLNAHGNREAAEEMHREIHGANVWGAPPHRDRSVHGGVFTAIRDFIGTADVPDDAAMWRAIERCDINIRWSGSIVQIGGEIYAYFCEMAATFEAIYGHETGIPVESGWWKWGMDRFDAQHREWCPKCGVPLRLRGHEDMEFTDDFSATHAPLVQVAVRRNQHVELHEAVTAKRAVELTDYQRLRTPA